ncbi:MAG: hypothetical protein DI568_06660 [Sphingomonas sp.]|nr:MAG: hypothetical protein DI568_06660 [Sphingomonas sp.]
MNCGMKRMLAAILVMACAVAAAPGDTLQQAVIEVVAHNRPPALLTAALQDGPSAAGATTELGWQDIGRFEALVQRANPQAAEAERQARVKLAYSLLMLLRRDGQMSAAGGGYARMSPLDRHIELLAKLVAAEPSLRRGEIQLLAADAEGPGLLAVARRLPEGNRAPFIDTILLFNTSGAAVTAAVAVDPRIEVTKSMLGDCPLPSARGVLTVEIEPFGALVCAGAVAVR